MKIVFAAGEAAGFIKTGGLGDVARALPLALSEKRGQEVFLFLPYYGTMKRDEKIRAEKLCDFTVSLSWRKQYCGLWRVKSKKRKLVTYLIDNEYYFDRDRIYGCEDDGERFAFFSKAILESLVKLALRPDIIHCNDWQTALVPTFLHAFYHDTLGEAKTVFTIHNVEYQGWADPYFLGDVLGLGTEYENAFSFHGSLNFVKSAILACDALTTVSEQYARELTRPEFAHGLHEVLSDHAFKTCGIVNGFDPRDADPETNGNLAKNYTVDTFPEGKKTCKAALCREVGLPFDENVPLVGMVSRLVSHKGLPLLISALERWKEWQVRFVILGTGDKCFEDALRDLAERDPDRIAFLPRFSVSLADRIYAGCDLYLMPSQSEPCGLSQMIAMRYGTPPIVHKTGGLADTVPPAAEGGLGFVFDRFTDEGIDSALREALTLYHTNPDGFADLVRRNMTADHSWKRGAASYLSLYRALCGKKY